MHDVAVELKGLRLHGMAGAWVDLVEQGSSAGLDTSRWLVEHLLKDYAEKLGRKFFFLCSFLLCVVFAHSAPRR